MLKEYFKLQKENDELGTDDGSELSADNIEVVKIKDSAGNEIEVEFEESEDGTLIPTLPEDTSEEDFERLSNDKAFQANISTSVNTLGNIKKTRMEQKQEMTKLEQEKAKFEQEKADFEEQKLAFARQQQGGLSDADAKKYWNVDTVEEIEALQTTNHALWLRGQADYNSDVMLEKMKTALPQQREPEKKVRTVADIKIKTPKAIDSNVAGGGKGKQKSKDPFDYL